MSRRTREFVIATDKADADVWSNISTDESRRARIRIHKIVITQFDAYAIQADVSVWAIFILSASKDGATDTADTSEPFGATTISTRSPASTIDTNHSFWTIGLLVVARRATDSIYTYPIAWADVVFSVRAEDRRQANAIDAFVSRRAFC